MAAPLAPSRCSACNSLFRALAPGTLGSVAIGSLLLITFEIFQVSVLLTRNRRATSCGLSGSASTQAYSSISAPRSESNAARQDGSKSLSTIVGGGMGRTAGGHLFGHLTGV